jgi:hypothetical protein
VTSLLREGIARSPVLISMKQPVPYVFFTMPGVTQRCPKSAACWSPATPLIGIGDGYSVGAVSPNAALDGWTSGSIVRGTPKISSSSSSQRP